MNMAGGGDQRLRPVDHPAMGGADRRVVPRVVGEREAAVLASPTVHVEDGIEAGPRGVEKLGVHRMHALRHRRAVRDEVEVPLDEDRVGVRREVVQHVVDDQLLVRRVAVAVVARQRDDRLLLPHRAEDLVAQDPHAVVQVDDVDRGTVPSRRTICGLKRVM